jgi:protein-tyrosine sulfotransferase
MCLPRDSIWVLGQRTLTEARKRSSDVHPHSSSSHMPGPDPVFILCLARSGSTLLRFLLDTHPDISCPAEMSLPPLCRELANTWSIAAGFPIPLSGSRDWTGLPAEVVSGIRKSIDPIVSSHLERVGKRLFCDKSLGAARHVEVLLQVYPRARFLCLYRHPMDVIASGLEACPWGLAGYGFDPYIAATPGNSVLALARW